MNTILTYAQRGIPTYVIGIQSQEDDDPLFASILDAMARAGGRPNAGDTAYYPARSQEELGRAILAVRDQVASCTYLTPSIPDAGGSIVVTLDGTVLPRDPSGAAGWTWGDESNGEVVLGKSTCAKVKGESSPALDVMVSCPDE